jgi:hypothetical protein
MRGAKDPNHDAGIRNGIPDMLKCAVVLEAV